MTPFDPVLWWQPPEPTIVLQPGRSATDSYVESDLLSPRPILQRKFAALQAKANTHMQGKGAQFKHQHNKKVLFEAFVLKPKVFVDKLPLSNVKNTEEEMATASFSKLQPHKPDFSFLSRCSCIRLWSVMLVSLAQCLYTE